MITPPVNVPVTPNVPPTEQLLFIVTAVPADVNVFVPAKVGTADTKEALEIDDAGMVIVPVVTVNPLLAVTNPELVREVALITPPVNVPVTLSVPPMVALLVIDTAVPAEENVFVPDKVGTADTKEALEIDAAGMVIVPVVTVKPLLAVINPELVREVALIIPEVNVPVTPNVPPTVALLVIDTAVSADEKVLVPANVGTGFTRLELATDDAGMVIVPVVTVKPLLAVINPELVREVALIIPPVKVPVTPNVPTTKRRLFNETSPPTKRRLLKETSEYTVKRLFNETSPPTNNRLLKETSELTINRLFKETSPPTKRRLLRETSELTVNRLFR